MSHPYQSGQAEATDLTPGDRILIAGRLGTFISLTTPRGLPDTITWCPDGTLAIETTTWPGKVTRSGWHQA